MLFGPLAPEGLPAQDRRLIYLLIDRFERAASAHNRWAEQAKLCVEFFEGKQWSDEDLAILEEEGRTALTFNLIKPLVMLVLGYHRNNRTQGRYLPGHDGTGTEQVADAITAIAKQIGKDNRLQYIDAEVFLDGLLTGRGWYDCRLDFAKNDLGDIRWRADDPFATYIDPDADTYEPETWNYLFSTRWVSLDELEAYYGEKAAQYAASFISGNGLAGLPTTFYEGIEEVTPARSFAEASSDDATTWARMHDRIYDFVDPGRKNIKLVDCQHYQWTTSLVFIDLETGRRVLVPDHWTADKIRAVVAWNEQRGNPIRLAKRRIRRVRWTTICGDLAVHDDWSPFKTFSKIPFFPYFRRGVTKGMVGDLIDPQLQVNRLWNAELNILGRSSNSGWLIPKGSMDRGEREHLEKMGGAPGITVEYDPKKTGGAKPEQIQPHQLPQHARDMGDRAVAKLKEIGGVNDSALGNLDRVQSGRAIEARQKQTIVGIEPYMDNYRRTKELCSGKDLEMIQDFYTERRMFRVMGEDSRLAQVVINDTDPVTGFITNDVTLGSYMVEIDETPLSSSFLAACFDELLMLREKGVPIPDDFLIDASSFGRKEELKQRMQEYADAGVILPTGQPAPLPPSPQAQQLLAAQAAQQGGAGAQMAGGAQPAAPQPASPAQGDQTI